MLHSVVCQLLTDVSAQPIGPIFKGVVKREAFHFGIKVIRILPVQGESGAEVAVHNLHIASHVMNNYKSVVLLAS
jgi:hypothetical protein